MNLPLKPHQLIAHWVPGLIVLMALLLSYFKWNYIDFISVFAKQGSVATISIILLSIGAFLIGEFIDCLRDLWEWIWERTSKYKINCDYLFSDSPEMVQKQDSYWTYYVMCCNVVISVLLCLLLYWLNIITLMEGMTISRVGWVIGIVVTIVFAANACTLRKEISEITSNVKDNHNKDETVPNFTLPHYGVFTRICQSKIHGVGVFAIRDIPKYTYIFTGDNSKMVWVNKTVVDKQEPNIKKLYDDFCVIKGDKYYCPDNFNNMNIGWFLNESKENPNVGCDENYDFYALNDISKGEELTLSYTTFSDEPE